MSIYDLTDTTQIQSQTINGAIFETVNDGVPSGSGVFSPFLSIEETGKNKDGFEQGFNTDASPLPLDDTRDSFTQAIQLGGLTKVTIGTTDYFAFKLDANEPNSATGLVSLQSFKIYTADTGTIDDLPTLQMQNLVYNMDTSTVDNRVDLNAGADAPAGSGKADLFVYVPESNFAGLSDTAYVYLYSSFGTVDGQGYSADAGYEEWAGFGTFGQEIVGAIGVDKKTTDSAAPAGTAKDDAGFINVNEPVTWTYTVSNEGNAALSNVTVTDNKGTPDQADDLSATYVSGDDNGNGKLDTTEAWTYQLTGVARLGSYTNQVTVAGDYADAKGVTQHVTAQDSSSYFGADPEVSIVKDTVDFGAGSNPDNVGDGLVVVAGDAIGWTYKVTNTGNVGIAEADVKVTDDKLSSDPVYASGDNGNNMLDVGETWTYTASGTAGTEPYSNTGIVKVSFTDSAGHVATATASDGSSYTVAAPKVSIVKDTVDFGAGSNPDNVGDDLVVVAGDAIGWTYKVTNTGNVAIAEADVKVTDDKLSAQPVYASGDDGDHTLEVGETWTYTASGTAGTEPYSNTGTVKVSFTDSAGHVATATASDGSSYTVAAPKVSIVKDTVDFGAGSNPDNVGDGLVVVAGDAIGWTYKVTNTGNVGIAEADVKVTDDKLSAQPVYASGDDGDHTLEVGETWIYKATGTAGIGAYSNTGTAKVSYTDAAGHVATASAADGSSYFGVNVDLDVEKYVSVDGGKSWVDADTAPGAMAKTQAPVMFKFVVQNLSNVELKNVVLSDDTYNLGPDGKSITIPSLKADDHDASTTGDSYTLTISAPWQTGQHTNVATVTGGYTDLAGHVATDTDTDAANYFGFLQGVTGRTAGYWSTHLSSWSSKTSGGVLIGDANGNGVADGNETTFFVTGQQAALALVSSSDSTGSDVRQILLKQAIVAQLNIYNGDKDPGQTPSGTPNPVGDLVGEAAAWLKAYGGSPLSDGVLDSSDYKYTSSTKTWAFTSGLTGKTDFWSTLHDVDSTSSDVWVTGQGLKNTLEAYNKNQLVVTGDDKWVGWNPGGEASYVPVDPVADIADAFWKVAKDHGVVLA
ncbi:DUF7507 domain-containing protein [Alsobacter sp. R-9]